MKRIVFVKAAVVSALMVFLTSFASGGSALAEDSAVIKSGHMDAILKLETIKENYLAGQRGEALQVKNDILRVKGTGPASAWLQKVQPNRVNMATNRLEKQPQAEIKFDGKAYFVSSNGADLNMSQNPSTRFARDPMTNKTVDKADAVIYADASSRVYYFESEASYKNFLSLATPETIYGYSEPR